MKEVKKWISLKTVVFVLFGLLMISSLIVMIFTNMKTGTEDITEKSKSSGNPSSASKPEAPTPQQQIAAIKISLRFGDKTENVDSKTISSWVSGKRVNGKDEYKTNDDAIKEYSSGLAKKYSTYSFSIPFKTAWGEEIDIENKSTGWIFDEDYSFKKIKQTLLDRKSLSADLTDKSDESKKWWLRIAGEYKDYTDYGNDYVEVSIGDQHMWAFKNGKVVLESDIVSGSPGGSDTPKGAFLIGNKKKEATLYGPGYMTVVDYWMTIQDDIGFHDASWQESFGGDVYLTNGSHGCVNLPTYAAAALYDIVYEGMPVFIY